jgi:hypothetical protein
LNIKFALDRPNLLAQRRLLHAKALRRSRDMFFLGNGDEISKVPQLHRHIQNI